MPIIEFVVTGEMLDDIPDEIKKMEPIVFISNPMRVRVCRKCDTEASLHESRLCDGTETDADYKYKCPKCGELSLRENDVGLCCIDDPDSDGTLKRIGRGEG